MKKLFALVLALMLALSLAACSGADEAAFEPDLSDLPEIEGVDVEELIEDFAEDDFNVIELKSGEKETPLKAATVLKYNAKCYSTDESVAKISDKGVITAKSQGACYVILTGQSVSDDFAANFPDKDFSNIEVYKVMVDVPAGMGLSKFFGGMDSQQTGLLYIGFIIMGVILVLGVTVIVVIVVKVKKANKTNAPGFDVPQYQVPQYQAPDMNGVNQVNGGGRFCGSCGQQVEEGNAFCPYCGGKM